MQQLSDIEAVVQYHLRRGDQLISTGTELAITNFVFRRFVALVDWEDYTRIFPLVDLTTADQKVYNFPLVPNFGNLLSVEIQDYSDDNKYKRVVPARSIKEWLKQEGKSSEFPLLYRLYRDISSEIPLIEFRPAPKVTGSIIRIDGIIEPTPFVSAIERTAFRNSGIDDAFALALAGIFAAKLGQQPRSQQLIAWAGDTIRLNTGKEISPDEIREQLQI